MTAAGLVVRKKHPTDGRQTAIHLTPAGEQLRTQIPRVLRQVEERALAEFSKAERIQLFELLKRLDTNLRG
jgi:DNA-binding MarR family transcriptional regulator